MDPAYLRENWRVIKSGSLLLLLLISEDFTAFGLLLSLYWTFHFRSQPTQITGIIVSKHNRQRSTVGFSCSFRELPCLPHDAQKNCHYDRRMGVSNVFSYVCVCVCLYVCESVFLSVQAITFELLHKETLFLVYRHVFTYLGQALVSRSLGQVQGHVRKMIILLISTC